MRVILSIVTLVIVLAFSASLSQAQPAARADQPGAVNPNEKRPDLMGRIVNVSEDGRTLTLAMPPRTAADAQPAGAAPRPEEAKVLLTDRTKAAFFGVGEGEARPAPGLMAMVWLEEGSKDQAARVRYMKREGEDRPDAQGRVAAVSPDGQSITLELRERDRTTGQDKVTGQTTIRIAPYTQSLYFGVDQGGARPTVDYLVVVWFEKGSKETAARIRFMK